MQSQPARRPRATFVVHELLLKSWQDAEFVRTTERLPFGNERGCQLTVEADRRLKERATGFLTQKDGSPPYAWLVGRRPSFELEVLEIEDRVLTLFMANPLERPQTVSVLFNGVILGEQTLKVSREQRMLRYDVPSIMQHRGSNVVQLIMGVTVSRKLPHEPVALPFSGLITRAHFDPADGRAVADPSTLSAPGVQASKPPVLRLPAGTAVRLGIAVPDVERSVLRLLIASSDLPYEISVQTDLSARRVLVAGGPGSRDETVDLSPWAGKNILLEVWARWVGDKAATESGALIIDLAQVMIPAVDALRLDPPAVEQDGGPSADQVRPTAQPRLIQPLREPSVLLVVLDALARRRSSAFGYGRDTTPVLARLADEGWRALDAVAPASYTLASVGTLLTGMDPRHHGVTVLPNAEVSLAVPDSAPRLARVFADHGWRTAGWATNPNAGGKHGYGVGFEQWHDVFDEPGMFQQGVDGHVLPGRLRTFLDELDGERFLAYVHVFEPHAPYDAPAELQARFVDPEYDGPVDGSRLWIDRWKRHPMRVDEAGWRHLGNLYDARVAHADQILGKLIEAVGQAGRRQDTIVLVTSDHGEALGEHHSIEHGNLVYAEQLDVPLVFVVPGSAGGELSARATLADVAPTLLGLAGLPVPAAMDGRDLLADPDAQPRPVLARSYNRRPVLAWISGHMKLVADADTRRRELYDLAVDPEERHDLSAGRPATTAVLYRQLVRALCDAEPVAIPVGADAEDLARLEAIGYLPGGQPEDGELCSLLRDRLRRF